MAESRKKSALGFIISLSLIIAATAGICAFAFLFPAGKIDIKATYYFVFFRRADNAASADSLSQTVESYGGAGYVLNYDDDLGVAVACYYDENSAQTVCSSLKRRDLDCAVKKIERDGFKLNFSAKKNAALFEGNLNTLSSIAHIAYECANGLDAGSYSQNNAKEMINTIINGIDGLKTNNTDNCFTEALDEIKRECDDRAGSFLRAGDLRYIQIAIIDKILNIELK